ncbi:MAG: hypothetical protein WCF94_02240 [bacterium]
MKMNQTMEEILKKLEELKKKGELDITTEEDVSIGIMNLIGAEEHLYFTAEKTRKPEYLDLLNEVREQRKILMKRLLPKTEGESWCLSKHLLSAAMRMMEVGTKLQTDGKKDEAKEMFDGGYKMYSMFWAIRFDIIKAHEIHVCGVEDGPADGKAWSTEDIVGRLVDCCKE